MVNPLQRDDTTKINFKAAAASQLKFPIENINDFKAYIRFQPIITTPPEFGEQGRIGELIKKIIDVSSQPGAFTGGAQGNANIVNQMAEFQNQGNATMQPSKRRPTGRRCVLYMPSTFNMQDGVSYSTAALGMVGSVMREGLEGGSGLPEAGVGAIKDAISSVFSGFTGSLGNDAARLAAARLSQGMSQNSAIDGAVRSSLKTSVHPNIALLFDKPELRSFRFQFKMQPTTEEEAKEIKAIVQFFREELYPESFGIGTNGAGVDDGLGGGGQVNYELKAGYKFPNEFQISLHYDLDQQSASTIDNYKGSHFFKFKPTYLRSVNATYNSSNTNSFYKGGYFQETTLDLNFQENELMDKQAVRNGY